MKTNKRLFEQLQHLTTEQRNRNSLDVDRLSISEILKVINKEDEKIARAVQKEIPYVAKAIELVVRALISGGRLIYVGAGTSGRLGILDATECPPTYGTNPRTIQGIIAGGKKAVFRSQEGVEDNIAAAGKDIRKANVGKHDVVCGIAASARTPYVLAALQEAKRRCAKTIYLIANPRSVLKQKSFSAVKEHADVIICPNVGPEVIMGSTRMKSGTAQKLVLNMITTTAMIRLGKVYENMMIDLKMNSRKLEERAKKVLMITTGVDYDTAAIKLEEAGWNVKTAIVMIKNNVSHAEARKRLKASKGFVRKALRKN